MKPKAKMGSWNRDKITLAILVLAQLALNLWLISQWNGEREKSLFWFQVANQRP